MKITVFLKKTLLCIIIISFIIGIYALSINSYVVSSSKKQIILSEEALNLEDVDCIIVLGCLVRSNGIPSDMLSDRLKRGVELYKNNIAPKILMSGDHGQNDYNEVQTMKQYALVFLIITTPPSDGSRKTRAMTSTRKPLPITWSYWPETWQVSRPYMNW